MTTLKEWSAAHRAWIDEFVLTLRLAGAGPAQIADLLADAHEKSDERGQGPEPTFGDPVGYAASLGYRVPSRDSSAMLRVALPVVVQVLLLMIGSYAVRDWILGHDVVINLATLICWVVMAAIVFVVMATSAWGSTAIYRVGVFAAVFGVAIIAGAAGVVLSRREDLPVVFTGTPVLLAVVSLAGVLGIAVFSTVKLVRASTPRRAWALLFWLVPVFMAFDAGYTALVG